jgi:c-di-GMP-binding flagellar brake protein YcgR
MRREFTEKRRQARLTFHIPMRYKKIESDIREFKGSLMKNISEGGASMSTYEFLPLNSRLAMEIPLRAGSRPVEGLCRVAWVKKAPFGEQYDAGVEFININQEYSKQIGNFILNKTLVQ